MNKEMELKTARATFDKCAAGAATMALADLHLVLAAIEQPQELTSAMALIGYIKRTSFDAPPEGRLSWAELQTFLESDGRDRR